MERSALVFAPVPMGYGSSHFLYVYRELEKSKYKTEIVEPIDKRLPFYELAGIDRSIVPSSSIQRLIFLTKVSLLKTFFARRRPIFVLGMDIRLPLPWLVSKFSIPVRYYYEIDDNFNYSTGSYPRGNPEVIDTRNPSAGRTGLMPTLKKLARNVLFGPLRYKAVIAPETNRLKIATGLYPEARQSFLVLNAPPLEPVITARHLPDDRPTVLYQGQVHHAYSCANILFETIEAEHTNYRFVIAGSCQDAKDRAKLDELTASGKAEYLGLLPRDELEPLRAKAHVSLVLWDNIRLTTRYASPNKLFEAIAVGLPVVCTPNESLVKWNNQFGFGEVMKEYSSQSLRDALKRLTTDKGRYTRISHANIDSHQRELNYEAQVQPIMKWLRSFN